MGIDAMRHLSQKVSYKINEFSTNVGVEIKRLKAQVELFWDKEFKIYRNFGLMDGMKILECGSGPGYVMEKILDNLPNSYVVGVEIDPYLVEISKKNLKDKSLNRFNLAQQSIVHLGFPDNCFDFVIMRLVLEHLPDPLYAVKEVFRVLKPGGKAVFIDNDFEMYLKTYPDIPELSQLYGAYCRSRIAEGGNPKIGRELPGILKRGRFVNVDFEIVNAHSEVIGDDIFLRSEGSGIPAKLVKDGYLSGDLLDSIANKWYELLQKEDHVIYRQLFIAGGEKNLSENKIIVLKTPQEVKVTQQLNLDDILTATREDQRQILDDYVCKLIADSLKVSRFSVQENKPIIELGFDSLMAVRVQNRFKSDLGINISFVDFFDNQSIVDIAKVLFDSLCKDEMSEHTLMSQQNSEKIDKREKNVWEEGEI